MWLPSVSAPSCPHVVLVLGAVFLDVDLDVVLDPVVVCLLMLGCAVASSSLPQQVWKWKQQVCLPSVSAPSCPHVVLVLGAVFLDVDLDVVLDPVVPQQVSNLGVVLDLVVVWCS